MKKLFQTKGHMIGKLFVFQIAMSLLGLFVVSPFVVSPFGGVFQIYAAIFSSLFYFSLITYAVIEDGQKDCVSYKAGRLEDASAYTGLKYSLVSYIPTIVISVVTSALLLFTNNNALQGLKAILHALVRSLFMGMYLGFDTGIAQRSQDPDTNQMVSSASETAQFFCDNNLIFVICLIFTPLVCGIAYMLAFKGIVHVNTSEKKSK